ncbi:hypothetical protein LXL04_003955 [Taraxacum kok-saghyz]
MQMVRKRRGLTAVRFFEYQKATHLHLHRPRSTLTSFPSLAPVRRISGGCLSHLRRQRTASFRRDQRPSSPMPPLLFVLLLASKQRPTSTESASSVYLLDLLRLFFAQLHPIQHLRVLVDAQHIHWTEEIHVKQLKECINGVD